MTRAGGRRSPRCCGDRRAVGSAVERRSRPPPRWWGVTTTVDFPTKIRCRRRSGGEESSPPEGSAHDPGRSVGPSWRRSACPSPTCGGAESAPPWASPRRAGAAGTPAVMTHHHRRGCRKQLRATGGMTDLPRRGAGRPTPGGPTSGPTPTRRARGCGRSPCRRWWPGCVTGNVRGGYPVRTPYAPSVLVSSQVRVRTGEKPEGLSERGLTLFSTGTDRSGLIRPLVPHRIQVYPCCRQ